MGIGYIFGCLLSIILWRINRQAIFLSINKLLYSLFRNEIVIYALYFLIVFGLIFLNYYNPYMEIKMYSEIYNFFTAFLVIDISCTERENLNKKEKVRFYDSISNISRAIVCGFTAPLLLVAIFGNIYGIIYSIFYNLSSLSSEENVLNKMIIILNIVPCAITNIILYIVYVLKNKSTKVDFKGDFGINLITRPLLNVDIMAACLEKVNFYYYYTSRKTDYIKSYGNYNKKIDEACIKDYLGIAYTVCLLLFIIFYVLILTK